MKKFLCLMSILALTACDKPKHDVLLVCNDLAGGRYMVDAKIYESKADLKFTRLTKNIREKRWLTQHLWLYNMMPSIDDTFTVSLPASEEPGFYEKPNRLRMEVGYDSIDFGLRFVLWDTVDNSVTMTSGKAMNEGEYIAGAKCVPLLDYQPVTVGGASEEAIKSIKNCIAYVEAQNRLETLENGEKVYRVFDVKSDREMYISEEKMKEFTQGKSIDLYAQNKFVFFVNDLSDACHVAGLIRNYIRDNIDKEYIKNTK